jgi:hypothetical protein
MSTAILPVTTSAVERSFLRPNEQKHIQGKAQKEND